MTKTPDEFKTSLRQHLQVANPVVVAHPGLECPCGVEIDPFNRLVNCCKCNNSLTIGVHNAVQSVLVEHCIASKSTYSVVVKKMYEDLNPGVNKAADVILDHNIAIDVRISSVGTKDISIETAAEAGYAARKGEKEKLSQYSRVKNQSRFTLVPFVIDSQGHMGPAAKKLFVQLCRRHAISSNIPLNILQNFWMRKYSCKLHKAIARRVICKVDSAVSLQLSQNFPYVGVMESDRIHHAVVENLSGLSPRDSSWGE